MNTIKAAITGFAATAAAGVAIAGCGGGSPATRAVTGHIMGGTQAGATVASALGNVHGVCAGAVPGGQVIVKGPSGKLLATTTMHGKLRNEIGVLSFTAKIPAGHGPYTIDVVGVSSLVVSAAQLRNLQLTC